MGKLTRLNLELDWSEKKRWIKRLNRDAHVTCTELPPTQYASSVSVAWCFKASTFYYPKG